MFNAIFSIPLILFLIHTNVRAFDMVVHESRATIPRGFVKVGPASPDTILSLRIALAQNNVAGLEQMLYAVSTPGSKLYGQHLSKEEVTLALTISFEVRLKCSPLSQVNAYMMPSNETVQLVIQWLKDNVITPQAATSAGDWLQFSLPVSKANELLETEYGVFMHEETGQQFVLTTSYSIPANLKGHLELVHPTIRWASTYLLSTPHDHNRYSLSSFPNPLAGKSAVITPMDNLAREVLGELTTDAIPASCNTVITPICYQQLYGIPKQPANQTSNTLAVSGFDNQFANFADLTVRVFFSFFPQLTWN